MPGRSNNFFFWAKQRGLTWLKKELQVRLFYCRIGVWLSLGCNQRVQAFSTKDIQLSNGILQGRSIIHWPKLKIDPFRSIQGLMQLKLLGFTTFKRKSPKVFNLYVDTSHIQLPNSCTWGCILVIPTWIWHRNLIKSLVIFLWSPCNIC